MTPNPFDLEHDEQVSLAEAFDRGLDAVYLWAVETIAAHRDEAAVMASMAGDADVRAAGL